MMQKLASAECATQTASSDFLDAVLQGLSLPQKALPSRFFYDEAGSALFERITELPEYYPTRAEIALLNSCAGGLRGNIPPGAAVVEFGSGSSRKTELLLRALRSPAAYIPIDISASALYPAARRIQQSFPRISVHPVLGSFGDLSQMQLPAGGRPCVGFFPGSTIGNLMPADAISFLQSAKRHLGRAARFVIGADLRKPLKILLPAYDDAQGVTAAFNRNILARINRELGGTFNLDWFQHAAIYNEAEGRIEMHLRASKAHRVRVAGRFFAFRAGETIHTENSYKYTVSGFQALARASGWLPLKAWTGEANLFSMHLLA